MSFRNRRKSSGHGSSFLSTRRRSSATQRELEQIIQQKRQRLPDWVVGLFMLIGPALLLFISVKLLDHPAESLFWPAGPLLVLLLTQIQLLFLWHLPAKELAQLTEEGHPLRHRATAFESCLLICLLYLLGALLEFYPGQLIFDHFPAILASLCLLSLAILLLLFLCLPSPEENRNDHSLISQLFYGRHLQPVLLNVDIKAFLTNRLALTLWALYLLSALFENRQRFPDKLFSLPLLTTFGLQLLYILRRQWFEHLHTGVDNRNDRAGFYRIWMALCLLPSIYLLPITVGVQQDQRERPFAFYLALFAVGIGAQWLNTAIDLQRHNFREKDGQLKLMDGKDPYYICAKFRRENGESGTGLLLGHFVEDTLSFPMVYRLPELANSSLRYGKKNGPDSKMGFQMVDSLPKLANASLSYGPKTDAGSGYWALCRHPNYATEFLTFLCWTLPSTDPIGYLPLLVLALILWLRMRKDELRCSQKYGQFWAQHCQKVPYLILPGIY